MKIALTRKIHALDFALLELGHYLDTHTWDKKALAKRNTLKAERARAVMAYEENFGPYIVTQNDVCADRWAWVDNPWPWEYCGQEDM